MFSSFSFSNFFFKFDQKVANKAKKKKTKSALKFEIREQFFGKVNKNNIFFSSCQGDKNNQFLRGKRQLIQKMSSWSFY